MTEIHDLKKAKETVKRLAKGKDILGLTIFGIPAVAYEKEDLICFIIYLNEKITDMGSRHMLDMSRLRGESG